MCVLSPEYTLHTLGINCQGEGAIFANFRKIISKKIACDPKKQVCFHQWTLWIMKTITFPSLSWLLGSSGWNWQPTSSKFPCPSIKSFVYHHHCYHLNFLFVPYLLSSFGSSVYVFHKLMDEYILVVKMRRNRNCTEQNLQVFIYYLWCSTLSICASSLKSIWNIRKN